MHVFDVSIKTAYMFAQLKPLGKPKNISVIDPDECIDCAACIPECPAEAIYADTDSPEEEMSWLEKNEEEAPDLPIAEGRLSGSSRPVVTGHYISS